MQPDSAALDRLHRRLVGGQRQQGEHLAEVPPELRAHELGRSLDVPGVERATERRGAVTNGVDIHRNLLLGDGCEWSRTTGTAGYDAPRDALQVREKRDP